MNDVIFEILVNGKVVTKAQGAKNTPVSEFVNYWKGIDESFDESKSVLTIREYTAQVLEFKTNAYMQNEVFACQLHIDNLIATFGVDIVADVIKQRTGRAA